MKQSHFHILHYRNEVMLKPLLFISLLYHGKKVIDQKLSKEREILA